MRIDGQASAEPDVAVLDEGAALFRSDPLGRVLELAGDSPVLSHIHLKFSAAFKIAQQRYDPG
jgi:hypothetical protein